MSEYNGIHYGECSSRGEGGEAFTCGMFHEFVVGSDGFCNSCRPSPKHSVIIAANKWMKDKHMKQPEYGSKEFLAGLMAWDKAGRPGAPKERGTR